MMALAGVFLGHGIEDTQFLAQTSVKGVSGEEIQKKAALFLFFFYALWHLIYITKIDMCVPQKLLFTLEIHFEL